MLQSMRDGTCKQIRRYNLVLSLFLGILDLEIPDTIMANYVIPNSA